MTYLVLEDWKQRNTFVGMCRASAQRLLDDRRKAFYMCLAYAKVLSAAGASKVAGDIGNLHIGSPNKVIAFTFAECDLTISCLCQEATSRFCSLQSNLCSKCHTL